MELGYHSHLSQGAPIAARTPDPGGAEALRRGAAAAMPAATGGEEEMNPAKKVRLDENVSTPQVRAKSF